MGRTCCAAAWAAAIAQGTRPWPCRNTHSCCCCSKASAAQACGRPSSSGHAVDQVSWGPATARTAPAGCAVAGGAGQLCAALCHAQPVA
jgi:hypothetical protein